MSNIRIIQKNDKLIIKFNKRRKHISKLIIKNKDFSYEVENTENNTFNIDFKELSSYFKNTKYNKLYLLYETDNGIAFNQNEINIFDEDISIAGLKTINFEEISFTPYISDNFNFQISLLSKLPLKTYYRRSHIDSLSINTHKAKIKGKFSLKKINIDSVYLTITSRVSQKKSKMPIKFKTYSVREEKLDTTYAFESDFATLLDNFLIKEHDGGHMYDLFIEVNTQELGEPLRFKIGRPRALTERFLAGEFIKEHKNYSSILSPYFTLKGRNISFYYDEISNQSVDVYKKIINNKALLFKKPNKEIWVIGEKPDKAQDNGYHLFKYLRENYPEKEVYYVIDENSPDIDKVKQLGNVVFFKVHLTIF